MDTRLWERAPARRRSQRSRGLAGGEVSGCRGGWNKVLLVAADGISAEGWAACWLRPEMEKDEGTPAVVCWWRHWSVVLLLGRCCRLSLLP